jgi:glycosyltransferase involved in cell wall biosynthesis
MFLAMGVPVIASRQPSFEFIERYGCGVLVNDETEFRAAVGYIRDRLEEMRENALLCAREYIDPSGRFESLKGRIEEL